MFPSHDQERLKAVVSGNYFYRCTKCGIVTMLTPSFVWEKKGFDEMLEKLQEARKPKKKAVDK